MSSELITGLLILKEYGADFKADTGVIWAKPTKIPTEACVYMLLELGWFDRYVPEVDDIHWGFNL